MEQGALLIRNACILTGCGPVFEDGFLMIRDGRIAALGPMALRPDAAGARGIDAEGRYLLPGLINPHMHFYGAMALGMTLPRMRSFGRILEELWWRLDEALTLEDVAVSAELMAAACVRAGVTTVFDHHASYGAIRGSLMAISQVLETAGLRASLSFEISDRNGPAARDEALAESGAWLDYVSANRELDPGFLQRGMVGLHASMTLSDETLLLARELMEAYGCGAHVHVAEGAEDVRATRRASKLTPVARLSRARILTPEGIAAHGVHVTPADLAILKRSGVAVAHNPLSNLGNAVGIAPALAMVRRGIPVVIGTDGMSAGIAGDARLASVLHRTAAGDAQAGFLLAADALWKRAPALATRAFEAPVGTLRKGAAADVILSEARPRTPVTPGNAAAHLLLSALDAPVRTTICAGRILMQDHELVSLCEEESARQARLLARRLWKRM